MPSSGPLGTGRGRIVAAVLAAALVAQLAVLLLSPGDTGPDPAAVATSDFLDPVRSERAGDFREGQRNLGLAGLGIEIVALGLLAAGRPQRLRRLLERAGGRPLLGAAAAGALISVLLTALALPVGYIAFQRSVDIGLSTQDAAGWLGDRGRSAAIGAVLAALGALVLVAAQRRLPRAWWLAGAGVVVAYAVVITWLAPALLKPLFNDFEPLPEGSAREATLELADRAGVDVGEVYLVDASRRSTGLNAFVDGLGSSKRVVLYDNLIDGVDEPVLRSVIAHELGHVAHRDLPRGILFVALVAPLGMLVVALVGGAIARRGGTTAGLPAAIPSYALAVTVVSFGLGLAGSQLSREVEASADAFALELTDDPRAFIELQKRLAAANFSDPDPSGVVDGLLRTHPTTVERIGTAIAFESSNRLHEQR